MVDTVSIHNVAQYTTNVEMLLQQSGSRFQKAVTTRAFMGEKAVAVEQFADVKAVTRQTRYDDTALTELGRARRWIYPSDESVAFLFDDKDALRQIVDPKNPHVQSAVDAMARATDDRIIKGIFGSNNIGQNGEITTGPLSAFNAGSQVIDANVGGTGSGLNAAKLKRAKVKLMAAQVELEREQAYIAISAKQYEDLLNEIQVISKDYGASDAVTMDGVLRKFMGFNIIVSERIPGAENFDAAGNKDITGYDKGLQWMVPCWVSSGVCLGVWDSLNAKVNERPDKNNMEQLLVKQTTGSCRLQEKKVLIITCN